jgi:uncharacterized membrane protein
MMSTLAEPDRSSRWLLIASLALNLFFVATAGALYVRHQFAGPAATQMDRPRTAQGRIERIAANLPAADAEKLRAEYRARASAAEAVRETLNRAYERIQGVLRAEPFSAEALRAAMTEARGARIAYDQTMQDLIATAAASMSLQGRNKLADGPPRPTTAGR